MKKSHKVVRAKRLKRLRKSFIKYKSDVKKFHPDADFKGLALHTFIIKLNTKPKYGGILKPFVDSDECFNTTDEVFNSNIAEIPSVFSIIENYEETTLFLKKMINTLHLQSYHEIKFDYKNCVQIDVCASMCMDLILNDFILYFQACGKGRHKVKISSIEPINFSDFNVRKILFSIGAYRNLKGIKFDFQNIIPFSILIGNKDNPKLDDKREVDITKTVDYIKESLSSLNRTLTSEAETNFYKVIGEVIQNAEEHSSSKYRFLIGYFEKPEYSNGEYGVFNLAILNFGSSFYETFKTSENPNKDTISQMEDLSKKYTSSGWFKRKKFEEETLWTLYALQDGVTRFPDWKRGNGTMRFIEKFLDLKGDESDDFSKMVITSGHTRIIFDGTYNIVEVNKHSNKVFKMMTFNNSGSIEDMPDSNYVKYEPNYFPGTMISVKLKLDSDNTEKLQDNGDN